MADDITIACPRRWGRGAGAGVRTTNYYILKGSLYNTRLMFVFPSKNQNGGESIVSKLPG